MSSDLDTNVEIQNADIKQRNRKWQFWRKWCRHGFPFWCKKYFWEGQLKIGAEDEGLEMMGEIAPPFANITPGKRKLVGWLLPAAIFHVAYWSIMIHRNLFYVFVDKYPMSITMVFGSVIAGMTSVGGGAVAFPVITLVLNEAPAIGRDLAMSLQSCGMSAASFSIFFMNVHIELHALVFSLLGTASGVIVGLEVVDPNLSPAAKKMAFSCIFFAFAFTLFLINWNPKRKTVNNIVNFNWWKKLVIVLAGFVGGLCTSFSGGGADLCVFSVLTLLFKISEKVATPTSVVIMALTSCVGWFWRAVVTETMPTKSWEYLLCVIPIVTVGAPFGALIGTHFHRLVLAACVYILTTSSLIGAFCIVPQTPALSGVSVGIIIFMFALYFVLSKMGDKLYKLNVRENVRRKSIVITNGLSHVSNDFCRDSNGQSGVANPAFSEYNTHV